jgi:magnesium-transporting ATPase (P-type)
MMVLVANAIGISWLYSVLVTAGLSGEVFYDAGAMLATFVLLGHWFEMRARGGASDAIRALLDLAPPMALVLRDGEPVELATAEVAAGDLLLIRPGAKVPVDAEGIEGESEVDESTVTGESVPVHKASAMRWSARRTTRAGRCARDRDRRGYRAGPDRHPGAARTELKDTGAAARRSRRVLARAGRPVGRRHHVPGLGGDRRPRCP